MDIKINIAGALGGVPCVLVKNTDTGNTMIGPSKSLYVNSGDVIDLEVFAKYNAPTTCGSDVSNFLNALVGAFGLSPSSGSAINGPEAYNTFNSLFSAGPG